MITVLGVLVVLLFGGLLVACAKIEYLQADLRAEEDRHAACHGAVHAEIAKRTQKEPLDISTPLDKLLKWEGR